MERKTIFVVYRESDAMNLVAFETHEQAIAYIHEMETTTKRYASLYVDELIYHPEFKD